MIVTVPDPRSAGEIIRNTQFFAPQSMIIARSRYHIARPNLRAAGASLVVDEANTIGDELAREVVVSFKSANRQALGCALAGEKPSGALGEEDHLLGPIVFEIIGLG